MLDEVADDLDIDISFEQGEPDFPESIFDIKGMTLFFTLLMTAIVCILLGCGVPTTPTYLIMVTIAAPALSMMGVQPLVSHFFVFYYGVIADITPPVALAAYAGASMAGADPFKTGNTAFRLGLAKALVPFVFVYSPSLLLVTTAALAALVLARSGALRAAESASIRRVRDRLMPDHGRWAAVVARNPMARALQDRFAIRCKS